MYSYTIMPLITEHLEEICLDIKKQYEQGIAGLALFAMKLEPIGKPNINKVKILGEKYIAFRNKLAEYGLKCGILVQASMGHSGVLDEELTFQPYVHLKDGKSGYVSCPEDDGFVNYFRDAMEQLAKLSPELIMLDDDFRMIAGEGRRGCACPLHVARFNEKAGTDFHTREELLECLLGDSYENRVYRKVFAQIQLESRLRAAKAMREGIDRVNPKLQGAFCTCNLDPAGEIAKIMAGEGNPSILRVNNGSYAQSGTRLVTEGFRRAALQKNLVYNQADVYLAETDTFPRNRYSTSASFMHNHYVGSILEGTSGAKHFITRLRQYEPASGLAYRRILAKYSKFYEALSEIVKGICWEGCKIPLPNDMEYTVDYYDYSPKWLTHFLERMGVPVQFSNDAGGAFFMNGENPRFFTDAQIKTFFTGTLVLSSDAALLLEKMGYGEYLGVTVRECGEKMPTGEMIGINEMRTELQTGIKELVPVGEKVEIGSYACLFYDGKGAEYLFPSSTLYRNSLGGTTIVFGGTPDSEHGWMSTYSLLNESRKQQLIDILKTADCLPVYYPGDAEVYLRAGYESDGTLMVAFFNIGLDSIEQITLMSEKNFDQIQYLTSEGTREPVTFSKKENEYILDLNASILTPVVLFCRITV